MTFKAPQQQQQSSKDSESAQAPSADSDSLSPSFPPLSYQEPSWSSLPTKEYYFEIIKNGSVLGKSGIIEKSKIVAGRLPVCDIEIEHPSISRYHAIIQFNQKSIPFLYDLDSSHGTFVNKTEIEKRKFIRLQVGDMIRFGHSSRLYILQGPLEDLLKRENELLMREKELEKRENNALHEEVSWGFKQDAYEGDEWGGINVTGSVDRILIPSDAYYLQDPKKALQIFLDNNGADSQITYTQAPPLQAVGPRGEFTATLEITGLQGPLLATGKGKKKPAAEKDACLEACYKLEKLGILRLAQGSLAERSKRLRKELLEDEEDGNNYLDRTDSKAKKLKQDTVVTLDSLTLKRTDTLAAISALQSKIDELAAGNSAAGDAEEEEDELDAYMNKINNKAKADESKKLQKQLQELGNELVDLEKLIHIATPKGSLSNQKKLPKSTTLPNSHLISSKIPSSGTSDAVKTSATEISKSPSTTSTNNHYNEGTPTTSIINSICATVQDRDATSRPCKPNQRSIKTRPHSAPNPE